MEDNQIVALYWARNEKAITVTDDKYGNYLKRIAVNVLANVEDTEECVNDTYLSAWNSMPDNRPTLLGAYLSSITRNLALDKYRHSHAKRRGDGQVDAVLDELLEVAASKSTEDEVEGKLLASTINGFLGKLNKETRVIFVRRYYYMDSIDNIARLLNISEGKIKTTLFRTRKKLGEYLMKEGYEI